MITQAQLGYITYVVSKPSCVGPPPANQHLSWTIWNNFAYVDSLGTSHSFGSLGVSTWPSGSQCGGGPPSSNSGVADDGSGYTLSVAVNGASINTTLVARSGAVVNAPQNGLGPGNVSDTNGNLISVSISGGSTTFFDTLSSATPVLTVTGAGTSASPYNFAYTNPSGGTSSYKLNYTSYPVRTNFGCSGITDYNSASQPLVSSISLPDGTAYTFTYEGTPGFAGSVTGRLHSVTLPTGGTITYSYSGGNDGIICADGSAATLTRATPDGTWTYAHSESGSSWTTTSTDPQGNQTAMQFQDIYETQRKVYQGSTAGTLLETVDTCYNGSASPCTGTGVNPPITQVNAITTLPGAITRQAKLVTSYNGYGLITERDEYDFGSGAPGALTRKTVTTYNGSLGAIVDHPSLVQVFNGSGTLVAQTSYGYDQAPITPTSGTPQHVSVSGSRGNLTTLQRLVAGSTTLTQTFTYFDTGNVNQSTDTNNAQTGFSYGNCGNSFASSVSMPLALSASQVWNCTGGVETSATDANAKTTSRGFADPNFWRPTSTADPTSAVTALSYFTSPSTGSESTLNFNGTISTTDTRSTLDSLGRVHVTQQKQAQGSGSYDSVETDYDAVGRPSRVTVPYTGTAGQTNATVAATTTTYDALNRPLTVTDGGGGVTKYTYTQNDVVVEIDPAPTGENAKKRQLEYDGLGRLKSVCEITAAAGSGNCGQTVAQTGFLTKYTYNALDDLLTVTQNAQSASPQTRTYTYDGLARLTSENNPEGNGIGNVYTYDSDATCGTSRGDLVKRVDPDGNTTCYAYDALHRVTAITYPSGPYISLTPQKIFVYDGATVNGVAMANAKGRLAEAYTGPSTSKITDLGFSYSARGEVADTYESTPHSGAYYHVASTYWPNGLLNVLTPNLTGLPNWIYTPDGEGRINTVLASSGQNPVTGTSYNNFGLATGITYGSLDSDSFGYDPNTGRMTQYKFTVNGSALTGNLTWNANGSLRQLAISDPFTASNTQTCNYTYDDLARLGSTNCGAIFAQNYTYDPFGNIAKSGTISFQPTYNAATNRYSTLPAGTPAYDANGYLDADGFHTYSHDVEGKITQIDSNAVTMTYDALGRWVEKLSGGNYIQAVYDPRGYELALMFNGTALAEARTPLVSGSAARYTGGGLDSYFHPDWLGSTRFKSTPSRTFKDDVAFAPFGEQYVSTGPVDSFFTVAPHDMEADLRDFPARDYHTTQGRWLIPDPGGLDAVNLSNPQTLNRYAYVMNNPLAKVDPMGLDACFTYYYTRYGPDGPTGPTPIFGSATNCYQTIPDGQNPQQSTYGPPIGPGGGGRGGQQQPSNPQQPAKKVVRVGNYPSLDCDGYRAARSILPQTTKQGIEFGGFLYKNRNGRYSYSNPVAGTPTSIPSLFSSPQALVSGIVGWFHSHPLVPGYNNDMFSGNDLLITRKEGPGYLATADDGILKLAIGPKGFPQVSNVGSGACQVP